MKLKTVEYHVTNIYGKPGVASQLEVLWVRDRWPDAWYYGSECIRVLLADGHLAVRAGIRAILEKTPDIEVVGEAGDGTEA